MKKLILAAALLALAACTGAPPLRDLSVSQKAYYSLGVFVAAEEAAADLVEAPSTPLAAVRAIQAAHAAAAPLADALTVAARAYAAAEAQIKAAGDAGGAPETALLTQAALALQALQTAYLEARPALDRFAAAVASRKG